MNRALGLFFVLGVLGLTLVCDWAMAADKWQPAKCPLPTRWTKDVSPANALPEYPRPQMVRKEWVNLNGLWEYTHSPDLRAALRRTGRGQPRKSNFLPFK